MSSIGASERARAADEIREARDEYEAREARNVNRQRKELKKASQKHVEEVNKLQQQYGAQVDEVKDRQKEVMTAREQKFQNEIQRVKDLHLDQIRRKSQDAEDLKIAMRSAHDSQIEKERQLSSSQKQNLSQNYTNSVREQEKGYQEFSSRINEEMSNSVKDRSSKIREKFEEQVRNLTADKDKNTVQKNQEMEALKANYKSRLADVERKARADRSREQSNFETVIKQNQATNDQVLDSQRDLLSAERRTIQRRFNDTLQKKMEDIDLAGQKVKDQAMNRIDREVRSAQIEKRTIENQRILDNISSNRSRSLSERHIKEQFEDRMQEVEGQKNRMRDEIMLVANERIGSQNHKNEKVLQDTNRRHKLDKNIRDQQARDEFANLEQTTSSHIQHNNNQTDERIRKILNVTSKGQMNQQQFHEKSIEVLKNNYVENLADQQAKQMEQIQAIRSKMESRLTEQVNKAQRRLEDAVNEYESKLEKLKDSNKVEMDRMRETYEQKLGQRDKSLDSDRMSQEAKFKSKMSAQEDYHQREITRMEQRHQEQVANMAARVKALSRKA